MFYHRLRGKKGEKGEKKRGRRRERAPVDGTFQYVHRSMGCSYQPALP